jgi:hypothetical protein
VQAPFAPEAVVADFCTTLAAYGIAKVTGDRYAGEWPREQFKKRNVDYVPSERVKSDIYRDMLPLLNSRRCQLLDNRRLISQLHGLERRTARGGRDSIDHGPGAHDDLANAVAGALVMAAFRPVQEMKIVPPFIAYNPDPIPSHFRAGPNPFSDIDANADYARGDADLRPFGFTIRG